MAAPTTMSTNTQELIHRIFVYGTLKSTELNHHLLVGGPGGAFPSVRFEGRGTTQTKYPFVLATRHNLPCLLKHDGTVGKHIQGEVYTVTDEVVKRLDEFEDYPRTYDKWTEVIAMDTVTSSSSPDNGTTTMECWMYGISRFKPSLVAREPYIENYQASVDPRLTFVSLPEGVTFDEVRKEILRDDCL